jgi:TRAP-type mannitol/chloroaromatic compound transport system permease small subunit
METLGKFLAFVGKLVALNWESYFKGSGHLFQRVAEAPGSSFFEALFCLFLLGALGAMVVGIGRSLVRLSPVPFIAAVEWYTRLFGYIGAFIILVLVVAMVYEVLARYFFSAPTKWAFEMAYMLMGTSFMFGIAYCMQMGRHIRVDFVYDHVSLKKRQVIDLVGYMFLIPMLLWLTWGVWEYFADAYRADETSGESAWNPIIWPFKFTFTLGFYLLGIQTVAEICKCVLVLMGRDVPAPSAAGGFK